MGQQEKQGKVKELKGWVKEAVGIVTGDSELEREGSRQRTEGRVQESLHRKFAGARGFQTLALACGLLVILASCSQSTRPIEPPITPTVTPEGALFASSECFLGASYFTLQNLSYQTSIRLHSNALIVINQSFQVVFQPTPSATLDEIPGKYDPQHNSRTWMWDQTTNGVRNPAGIYTVILSVEDDRYDGNISPLPDPVLYSATFKILPNGSPCQ